jgi:5-formyltetrahydrofolate cyclo-ligase
MEERNIASFPRPVYGRIPNFIGANIVADKLDELSIWRKARIIKSNPDSPQKWVREKALKQNKKLYMAVPRLRDEKCFLELIPRNIENIGYASTIKGAFRYGKMVYPDEMDAVDLIVIGAVAVNKKGAKVGKGGGFSDLEYAIGREFNFVNEETPTLSTVHICQIMNDEIPMMEHDVPLDYLITRDEIMKTENNFKKPMGVKWDILGEKLNEVPILKKLKKDH